jgi:DNA-binding NarL/FixJ family response regulator
MAESIRILIAGDHPVVRDGLAARLGTQADFEVVATAATGQEAVRLAAEL